MQERGRDREGGRNEKGRERMTKEWETVDEK